MPMSTAPETPAELAANRADLHLDVRVVIAMVAVATLFVALRLVSRLGQKPRNFAWDDGMVILGYISILGAVAAHLYEVHYAFKLLSVTSEEAAAHDYIELSKGVYGLQVAYVFAYTFPKLSVCILYLRIFMGKITRIVTYCTIGFICAQWLSFFLAYVLICNPPSAYWNIDVEGTCVDRSALDRSLNGPSIATDLILLVLPLPTIWNMSGSFARKLGISLTFATGSIGLIASCFRWNILFRENINDSSIHEGVELSIWSIVEVCTYLIAACLPPLRGLVASCSSHVNSGLSSIFGTSKHTSADDSTQASKEGHDDFDRLSRYDTGTTNTSIARGGSTASDEIEKDLERMAQLDQQNGKVATAVPITRGAAEMV